MRVFVDESGDEWTAWEVHPSRGTWSGTERRAGADRRTDHEGRPAENRRGGRDRRAHALRAQRTLGVSLAGGWLAFQSGTLRRRLTPIPAGWQHMSDQSLAELCRDAPVAPPAITPIASWSDQRAS